MSFGSFSFGERTSMHCVHLAYTYALCASGAVNTQRFVRNLYAPYRNFIQDHDHDLEITAGRLELISFCFRHIGQLYV